MAYDPMAMERTREIFKDKIAYADSVDKAVSVGELIFIVTEWEEFRNPDLYRGKNVFDGRRILNNTQIKTLDYEGICW